jgi:hypothetical protein
MTKGEELAALDEFLKKLGSNTYIGTWLKSCRPSIQQALRNDVCPSIYTMTPEEFQKHRDDMVETCKAQCNEMKEAAELRSKQCQANGERCIDDARDALGRALAALNR